MVGCVLAHQGQVLAEGWHQRFGAPHAEIEALNQVADIPSGATMYVTLEPCSHFGKTPPCCDAVAASGVSKVVIATRDPSEKVSGAGIARLLAAGLQVEVGLCEEEARRLIEPFAKLHTRGRPFVIAKWAMTLDGKIASTSGDSQWISNERSRAVVHQLRGRVDAVMVGRNTALVDDPLLTPRPPGLRTPLRIVVDSQASLPLSSQLAQTAQQSPVLVAAGPTAEKSRVQALQQQGCEVIVFTAAYPQQRLAQLLDELGARQVTNLLVEGGGSLLGGLFDLNEIDEAHIFTAPKIIGGGGPSPLGGAGRSLMKNAAHLYNPQTELLDGDFYMHGRVKPL